MSEAVFTSPKALMEWNGRMAEAVLEAADEAGKRMEQATKENATTFANAFHAQAERSIDALNVQAKFRAKAMNLAREAYGIGAAPAGK
jgi:hypothetical protein